MQYLDPVNEIILTKFKDAKIPGIRNYFNGDVVVVGAKDMPCIYVTRDNVEIGTFSNAEDEDRFSMIAGLILDVRQDFGQNYNSADNINRMMRIVEGRDENYNLLPDTICSVLRKQNIDSQNKLWISPRNNLIISYGFRQNRRGLNSFSIEAEVRFTMTHQEINAIANN